MPTERRFLLLSSVLLLGLLACASPPEDTSEDSAEDSSAIRAGGKRVSRASTEVLATGKGVS